VLRGIDTSATHFGLRDLRERVRRLGGTFSIRPGDDSGLVLRARLPLAK
jgi:signal transduction histidine kinase